MIFGNDYADMFIESYDNVSDMDHDVIINEVYFGESSISPLLNSFSRFRKKWMGKSFNLKMNYDKDLLNFNRLVEDTFGFYRFCVTIDPSYSLNAYMLNVGYLAPPQADINKIPTHLRVIKNNKGFKFDKDAGITGMCVVLFGLLDNKEVTDREIIGIILHEIGHTFTYAVLNYDGYSFPAKMQYSIGKVLDIIKSRLSIDKSEAVDDSVAEVDLNKSGISGLLSNIKASVSKINPLNIVKNSVRSALSAAANMSGNRYHAGYTDEKFADTFAGMFGYGADVQSGLQKMYQYHYDKHYPKKTPNNIQIFLKVMKWNCLNHIAFMLNLKDEHPDGLARIQVQIEYLQRELSKEGLDPLVKKELMMQLEMQKKLIDDFINYSSDQDGAKAIRVYYTKLYEKYGGDIREKYTDNDAIFEIIDNAYENVKESTFTLYDTESAQGIFFNK